MMGNVIRFFKTIKLYRDRACCFVGKLTIEVYWPKLLNNSADIGLYAPTQISGKKFNKYNEWWITWAAVIRFFGFGIGIAWKHCDNPNIADLDTVAVHD